MYRGSAMHFVIGFSGTVTADFMLQPNLISCQDPRGLYQKNEELSELRKIKNEALFVTLTRVC